MRKQRTNILLPTTSFIVIGLAGLAWLAKGSDSAPAAGADLGDAHAVRAVPIPNGPAPGPENFVEAGALDCAPLSVPSRPALPPQRLSDDAGLLVAKMCELHLLADGTELMLDANQWSAFAAVVLHFQAIRQTHEASIATLRIVAPGQYRIEVPVYAEFGDELREQFSSELRAALGEPKAREVMAKLGDRLEGSFAGFGVSEQTLGITANATGQPGDIQVTRTARYWSSAENRATTRGETHLPVLEDPTGDNWGELLAMVRAGKATNGPG